MDKFERDLFPGLLAEKIIPEEVLRTAAAECEKNNESLFACLVFRKVIDEEPLLRVVARLAGLSYVNLKAITVDDAAVAAVPVRFAWHYEFMPIALEGNKLTIAVAAPLSLRVQDEIRLGLRREIVMVLAGRQLIHDFLKTHYGIGSDTIDKLVEHGGHGAADAVHAVEDIEKLAGDASVIKLVNQIVFEAYKKRATDIHVEPFRGRIRIRYRVDGILYDQNVPDSIARFLSPILSRLKIMCGLDITEHRIPQDGRTVVKTQDQVLDLRLSFIPTPYGESVVIRILPRKTFYSLEKLGLGERDRALIDRLIEKPNGIIFVTGPTGSGKTTTLYACLKKINKNEKKVVTIEDPIEYEVEDVTQIQVNPDIQLTFAMGLRSILRHDPDIIMVGEVRDRETADIAIRVALTGHLVFSTLHTNDAATGVTRLVDIGIEPYLVASSVEAFIAQRLVRIICPRCRREDPAAEPGLKKMIAAHLGFASEKEVKIFKGAGCEACSGTGFYGRTALYEILVVDEDIKRMIMEKANAPEIKARAIRNGMRTLSHDGWLKVMQGVTTPAEVLNVCQESPVAPATAVVPQAESLSADEPRPADGARTRPPAPTYPNDRRVYMRIPQKVVMRFRIVEKGAGDIVRINARAHDDSVFVKNLLDETVIEKMLDTGFQEVATTSLNIGAGGVVFESPYLLPIGSILEVGIDLPGGASPIKCLAKVVRVEKDLPRCFYIAVCYLDMTGVDRAAIDEFVKVESAARRADTFDTTG